MVLNDDAFRQLSHSIACVRFPLVFAIILLHGYSTCVIPNHDIYFKTLYPLSYWIGETAVPAYFFISGLLLFYSSKTYSQQLKSRFKTLFIPYMIWNSLLLLVYVAIWLAGFQPEILYKSLDDYTWQDYLRCFWDRGERDWGNTTPVMAPMWYIRNLMVMYLISPILYYVIRATGPMIPIICGLFWANANNVAFTLQTLTMFSLGAFFPINEINPIDFWKQYKIHIIILFVVFGILDNYLHIASVDNSITTLFNLPVHRMALVANTFFVIWLGTYLYDREWRFPKLSKAAFFIFCVHFPLMKAIRKICKRFLEWSDGIHILLYFISVALITVICYLMFRLLSRYCPWFIRVSTGDRG
jgi:hypothetical protein